VFFTVPVFGLLAYPIWLAKALAIVAVALFVAVAVAARRRRRLSVARLGLGTLAFLAVLVVGAALAWVVWKSLLALHPESASTLHFPDFEGSRMVMAAIYGAAVGAFVAASHLLSRRIGALELAGGSLVWLAALSLATAFFEPLFSAVALWPLVGGVAALAVAAFYLRRAWVAGALLALAAVPGPVLIVPLLAFEAIKVEDGAVVGVSSLLLLLGGLLGQLLVITGGVVLEAETEP
jgi:hypothetical protein